MPVGVLRERRGPLLEHIKYHLSIEHDQADSNLPRELIGSRGRQASPCECRFCRLDNSIHHLNAIVAIAHMRRQS